MGSTSHMNSNDTYDYSYAWNTPAGSASSSGSSSASGTNHVTGSMTMTMGSDWSWTQSNTGSGSSSGSGSGSGGGSGSSSSSSGSSTWTSSSSYNETVNYGGWYSGAFHPGGVGVAGGPSRVAGTTSSGTTTSVSGSGSGSTTGATYQNTSGSGASGDGTSGDGTAVSLEGDPPTPNTGAGVPNRGGVPNGGKVVTQPNGDRDVYDADGNLYGRMGANGYVFWPLSWPSTLRKRGTEAAVPPSIRPPYMDWNAVDHTGRPCPRLHDDNFPDQVPKDWSRDKIEQLIDEVETSIENRERVLDPTTESPEAHRGHEWRIQREKAWLRQLQEALGSVAGTAAAVGVSVGVGATLYKIMEGAGMFLDRATGVMFFMVSPPGQWDNHGGMGPGMS